MTPTAVLEQLASARLIADYADRLGVHHSQVARRTECNHLGAVLADAILQAGLSYQNVVRVRIERIQARFPQTSTLAGLIDLIDRDGAADLLLWNHPIKVMRFITLARFLAAQDIDNTVQLKHWLCRSGARSLLLGLQGIGPKTCDYLSCLVGIDCIAVDRHVKTFASEAGVPANDYENLKAAVSYAADLLGVARRDFDSWIWQTISARSDRYHSNSNTNPAGRTRTNCPKRPGLIAV
jgi:hypothetical protein